MRNDILLQALNSTWVQRPLRLFCDRKNLIYDSLGTPGEGRLDFLPLPEVIQRGFPINKGRFSDVEDRMINDGMTMEICILRAKLFPEKADECAGVRV